MYSFDRIDHDHLLLSLGSFPARGMIREWLKAGVIESGEFTPTDEGTPQGGVISPVLLNVALHGMEQAAGVRYRSSVRSDAETVRECPVLVRYADDYVAMCHTREQAEKVKADLADWLKPRGLAFNEDKTRVVHVKDGFSFLGFDIRRQIDRQGSAKLLITPSKESVKRLRKRLRADVRSMHGANAAAVVFRLNPVVRGWSAYYRSVVSSRVFTGLDHYVWHITYRWTRRSHPNKSRSWVATRYFGLFNKFRRDRWVFGDRVSGAYLTKFSWTRIVRHVPVEAGRLPTTRPWTATGPIGGVKARPRPWTSTPPGSCEPKAGAAHLAGSSCCTPITNHAPHSSGNSGSSLSGGSCASSTSSSRSTVKTGRSTGSFTLTANGGSPPPTATSHDADAETLCRPRGLLEPDAWKAGTSGS